MFVPIVKCSIDEYQIFIRACRKEGFPWYNNKTI